MTLARQRLLYPPKAHTSHTTRTASLSKSFTFRGAAWTMRSGSLASLTSIRSRDADRCQPHVNAPHRCGAVAQSGLAAS